MEEDRCGDVSTLEWIRDRIAAPRLDKVDVTRIDTQLRSLRSSLEDEKLQAAAATATALRKVVARLG